MHGINFVYIFVYMLSFSAFVSCHDHHTGSINIPTLCQHSFSKEWLTQIRFSVLRGGGGQGESKAKTAKPRNNPTENRLFISNLPRTLDDEGLLQAFERFGTVEEARVMRDIETGQSRRMGYISFKESRAVNEAIDEMHETVRLHVSVDCECGLCCIHLMHEPSLVL